MEICPIPLDCTTSSFLLLVEMPLLLVASCTSTALVCCFPATRYRSWMASDVASPGQWHRSLEGATGPGYLAQRPRVPSTVVV